MMADSELAAKLARQQQKIVDEKLNQSQQKVLQRKQSQTSVSSSNGISSATTSEAAKVVSSADPKPNDELQNRLARRRDINEGKPVDAPYVNGRSIYVEFSEFSRKALKSLSETFNRYDVNRDGFLCFEELKFMMEKLGEPQTHLALKAMIREVDEDQDSKISLREFLLIFRKAAQGSLVVGSGLSRLTQLTEVDVHKEGVLGAKNFFESKIDELAKTNDFEAEIREEQEQRRVDDEMKRQRRAEFVNKQAAFNTSA